jgi:hypothetical protein
MKEPINLVVVEGALEIPAARKMLEAVGLPSDEVQIIDKHGKERFWADAPRYNQASATIGPILGLTDLDQFPCPSGLIQKHLKQGRHPKFILRIAVRELDWKAGCWPTRMHWRNFSVFRQPFFRPILTTNLILSERWSI